MDNCECSFLSIPLKTSNFHSFQNWEELDLSLMKIVLKLLKNTLSILALFTLHIFFSTRRTNIYYHSCSLCTMLLTLLLFSYW